MADMDTYDNEPRAYDGMNLPIRDRSHHNRDHDYHSNGRDSRIYRDIDDPYGYTYRRGELEFNLEPPFPCFHDTNLLEG